MSAPGRSTISTPARPTKTAAQRRGPTRSPRKGTESATRISGPVKSTMVTVVIGVQMSETQISVKVTSWVSERIDCSHGWRVANSRQPIAGMKSATMKPRCTTQRNQMICAM